MIKVFYDGKCGLCRREIEHYKSIAPQFVFNWVDITVDKSALEKLGINYVDGLKLLHAKDEHGDLQVGVDAFLLIWRQIPRWRILAKIVGFPGIRFMMNLAYKTFAVWRFNRLAHCQIAIKKTDPNRQK
jgi:predicted DCC family thiol-disulfide oxidoreductase YuxK